MSQIDINSYLVLIQKIFAILGSIIYFVFALIVVKQTTSMSKNIKDKFNPILITFSSIHLIFALILIFLALTIL